MLKSSNTIKNLVKNIQQQTGDNTANFPQLVNKETDEANYAIPLVFKKDGKTREFLHPIKYCPFSGEPLK